MNNVPQKINQAILAIWFTIGLSVIASLISKWRGDIVSGEFVFNIIFYSLFCIFPYKLSKGSNSSRWVYTVLVAVSVIFMLGGIATEMSIADLVVSIIMIPVEVFIIYHLFRPEANEWFTTK